MSSQISEISLSNFGMLPTINFQDPSRINLVIGENGTGKTFFLKALYSATRAIEEYRRGDDIRSISDVLSTKLRWTFQVEKLGDMVAKGSLDPLSFRMTLDNQEIDYQFSNSAATRVGNANTTTNGRSANSIFIPAKEVLSLYSVILKSREVDKSFGFDDTYYDLVKALNIAPRRGKNYSVFANSRKMLSEVIEGKVDLDEKTGRWYYKDKHNFRFSIGATSEGIKKISILDRLLGNGYLDNNSIIFIDEVESALHPDAVCKFLDIIFDIANDMGLQFFIASHSYFVIKKLALIATKEPNMVTCVSLHKDRPAEFHDLYNGIPNNSIIDASIRLYEQELEERL